VQTEQSVIQENLLSKCDVLAELDGGAGSDAYVWILRAVAQYNECATRHNGLVDVVKSEDALNNASE
jgi:hypothetical protein